MRKLAVLFLGFSLSLPAQQLVLSGRRAPSFSLPDATLKQYDILDYRGRWLLLDFMRTDCPHCESLSKILEGVKTQYAGKVAVLSVVLPPDNPGTVARYMTKLHMTSPIVFDASQVAISYFKATPTNTTFDTPHLFVIDPNGMIVKDFGQFAVEVPAFKSQLDQVLSGKK